MRGLLVVLVLAGCKKEPVSEDPFPEGFLWGTATAGFQVEGGCPTLPESECVDPGSDWYQWVTDPELVAQGGLHITGESLSLGPGMWETFEEDADRMQSDGFGGYRMGIEWSRLFPDGAAEAATTVDELAAYADDDAVARYHEMLDALHARGIEPLVTVNHYTLPLWVHDGKACHFDPDTCEADGWMDRERIVRLIGLYAGYLGREYGDQVELWATLNEPLAVTLAGYLAPGPDRSNPPGLSADGSRAIASVHNQIEGSAAIYDALHAEDPSASVGVVMNMVVLTPKDEGDPADELGVEHVDHLYHALFLDGLTSGAWDADVDGEFETTRPELAGRLDWIGVNYYAEILVQGLSVPLVPEIPISDVYPEISWVPPHDGMAKVVARTAEYGLPMYVTENGLSHEDPQARVDALDGVLGSLQDSVEGGADVRGYFYWSFVDNYEWNHGMSAYQFGMYGLDVDTKARIERPILVRYREIVADNAL